MDSRIEKLAGRVDAASGELSVDLDDPEVHRAREIDSRQALAIQQKRADEANDTVSAKERNAKRARARTVQSCRTRGGPAQSKPR